MADIRPVRTEDDYEAALARIDALMGAEPGTPDGRELDVLVDLVEFYESRHEPMGHSDSASVIEFRMERLQSNLLIDELRRLAPELVIAGGSFAHWLPHPRDVPPTARERLLMEARRNATGKCLTELVASIGLPAVEPARRASGAREWPAGYAGSVSHKDATVVAAITPAARMRSIGIDVERLNAKYVSKLHGLDAVEQPWSSTPEAEGRVVLSVRQGSRVQGPAPGSRTSTRFCRRRRVVGLARRRTLPRRRPCARRHARRALFQGRSAVDGIGRPAAGRRTISPHPVSDLAAGP